MGSFVKELEDFQQGEGCSRSLQDHAQDHAIGIPHTRAHAEAWPIPGTGIQKRQKTRRIALACAGRSQGPGPYPLRSPAAPNRRPRGTPNAAIQGRSGRPAAVVSLPLAIASAADRVWRFPKRVPFPRVHVSAADAIASALFSVVEYSNATPPPARDLRSRTRSASPIFDLLPLQPFARQISAPSPPPKIGVPACRKLARPAPAQESIASGPHAEKTPATPA